MCFLGTEKYPDENSFGAFLNEHGGSSNAYTASEETNYHFEVMSSSLREALARFATFFTCPLFTASATARELQAVDSEHSKNLQNDSWRAYELDKATSDPSHPYAKFGTGNSTTLRDAPAAAGIDVRAALLAFHATHYAPARATLCVLGSAPASEIAAWAAESFASWAPSPTHLPLAPTFPGDPHGGSHAGVLIKRVPTKDSRSVTVSWSLPSQQSDWKGKAAAFVGHLVGHEGPGSLLSCLMARGWALELSAGLHEDSSGFASFGVSVDVSETGFKAWEGVVALIHAYVGMLLAHGAAALEPLWIEDAALRAARFRFKSKKEPYDTATSIASAISLYPDFDKVLTGDSLLFTWSTSDVDKVLKALDPTRARVSLVSKALDGPETTKTEHWYGTKYDSMPLSPLLIAGLIATRDAYAALTKSIIDGTGTRVAGGTSMLAPEVRVLREETLAKNVAQGIVTSSPAALAADVANIYPPLTLPAPNAFVATDFTLLNSKAAARRVAEASALSSNSPAPEPPTPFARTIAIVDKSINVRREPKPSLLASGPAHELWSAPDDGAFALPKSVIYAQIKLPGAARIGAAGDAALEMLAALVTERLREECYDARLAGLNYDVSRSFNGLLLRVSGFSHRARMLAARLASFVAAPIFSDAAFALHKDSLTRRYASTAKDQPCRHSSSTLSGALCDATYSPLDDVLPALRALDASQLRTMLPSLLASAHSTVFVAGNVDADAAAAASTAVSDALAAGAGAGSPPPDADARATTRMRARMLPAPLAIEGGARITFDVALRRPARNESEPNGSLELLVQLGNLTQSSRDAALAHLAAHLIAEPFFDDLRTRQALGYVVQAGLRVDAGVASLRFIVQSTKVTPEEARARIEAFLTGFPAIIAALSPEAFTQNVVAVATARAEADKSLEQEAERLWAEISGPGRLFFERASAEVDALLLLTQADVVEFFTSRISPGGLKRMSAYCGIAPGSTPEKPTGAEGGGGDGGGSGKKSGDEGESGSGSEDDDEEGEDDSGSGSSGADDDVMDGDAVKSLPKPPVNDDLLAGGGDKSEKILAPGAELDVPLPAVILALTALISSSSSGAGGALSQDAVSTAFTNAGMPHVAAALKIGEKVLRIQAVCASRVEAQALSMWPDFEMLRRSQLNM